MNFLLIVVIELAWDSYIIHEGPLGSTPDHCEPCRVLVVLQVVIEELRATH